MTIQALNQRDSRWANIKLGTSTDTTIGSHGCTITCLAMAAGINPNEVNERMMRAGAYANTNLVNWTKLQAAIPWLQFEFRSYAYDNNAVKDAIAKNGYCLIEVDFDGKITTPNDRHWVLYKGNGLMIDPWTGVEKSTGYYPIVKGYAIVNRVGEPTTSVDEYSGLDLTNDATNLLTAHVWADVVKYGKYKSIEEYNTLNDTKLEQDKIIIKLTEQRDAAELARDNANNAMDGFRKENNAFIADLANIYGCRQEKPEIIANAKESITFEDLATEQKKIIDAERIEYASNLKTLNDRIIVLEGELGKIKLAQKQLNETKPSGVITTAQVKSVFDIIADWLKGRK